MRRTYLFLPCCLALLHGVPGRAGTLQVSHDLVSGGIAKSSSGSTTLMGAVGLVAIGQIGVDQLVILQGFWLIAGSDASAVTSEPPARYAFGLNQNWPNPLSASTMIHFTVPNDGNDQVPTTIEVFDIAGRRVALLSDQKSAPGPHQVEWRGQDDRGRSVASGLYICRLQCGARRATKRLIVLK